MTPDPATPHSNGEKHTDRTERRPHPDRMEGASHADEPAGSSATDGASPPSSDATLAADGIVGSARTVALFTAASRCLGLVRDVVCAFFFGAGGLWSAFSIAFMVPNLARRLFGEGALSAAFIPVLTDTLVRDGRQRGRRLSGSVLTLLATVLVGVTVLGCAALLIAFRALDTGANLEAGDAGASLEAGASIPVRTLVLQLSALLLPYMPLICLVAVLGGMLHVHRRFAAPAAAPLVLNGFIIATVLAGSAWGHWEGLSLLYAVAAAVLVAGVVQIVLQLWVLSSIRATPILNRDCGDGDVRRIMLLMSPMVLGMAAVQINTLADSLIALVFVDHPGAPAVLYYAQRLYQVPLGVFAISLATVIFPLLSRMAADHDRQGLARVFERGLRMSLFVAVPACVGLCLTGRSLTQGIFEIWGGRFGPDDTERVSHALWFYSLGIPAYAAQHVLVRTFYAQKISRLPARIAVVMVLLNLTLNLILVQVMDEAGVALATSISAAVQAVWLAVALRRSVPEIRWAPLAGRVLRTVAGSTIMGTVVWLVLQSDALSGGGGLGGHYAPLVRVFVSTSAGVAVYAMTARAIDRQGLGDLLSPSRR